MKKHITLFVALVAITLAFSASAQVLNTKLQVKVMDDTGTVVEGATVTLYKSLSDYESEENPVQSLVTDELGRVLFYELEARAYYMMVRKGDMTNIGRGEQTSKLEEKKKNMVNVVIE